MCEIPRIRDLFANPAGIELVPFVRTQWLSYGLMGVEEPMFFRPEAYPWEILDNLPDMLKQVCDAHPVRMYVDHDGAEVRASVKPRTYLAVAEVTSHPYPCLCDSRAWKTDDGDEVSIASGAALDLRELRQRGGIRVQVDASVRMDDYVYIGPNVQFRHNAMVIGPAVIGGGGAIDPSLQGKVGSGGVIGRKVTIKKSFLRSGVRINSGTDVAYAVIGRDVIVDPGATFLYERFDRELIQIHRYDGIEVLPVMTERRRLGPIIGDGCRIGSVTLHPGVILLPRCEIVSECRELKSGVYSPEYFERSPASSPPPSPPQRFPYVGC